LTPARINQVPRLSATANSQVQQVTGDLMARHHLWLLLPPFIGLLWVPFYNFHDPALFGFPFFYWYQLAWVPVTAFLTWIAYRTYSRED
jgi:hypothetical protein